MSWGLRFITDAREIDPRNCESMHLKIAKRQRSLMICAATQCLMMARKCLWARGRATTCMTQLHREIARKKPSRPPDWSSIAFPPKSGTRSSTKCGAVTETGSTYQTCMVTTGSALREQYKPLLQYVAHRSDLNYLISEMISELTVQHAYIEGGDFQIPPRPRVGLPGARFELDKQSGRYRIAKIFEGENEEDLYRSPL